jgi:DNA-binding NarL/FixJ family response regulator
MTNKNIKIVICDDHAIYRQGIKHVLQSKSDIDIIGEAEDGVQLTKLLKHVQPDLILLDINMPVMDGTVALPMIKKSYPDIKVLVLSMQNTPEMIKIMMSLGADGYLTKNDNEELIYTAIKECFETGRFITKRTEDVLIETIRTIEKKQLVHSSEPEGIPKVEIEKESRPVIGYKAILNSILKGLGVGVIVVLIIYIYYMLNNTKDPLKSYNPPQTHQNN